VFRWRNAKAAEEDEHEPPFFYQGLVTAALRFISMINRLARVAAVLSALALTMAAGGASLRVF